jgi:DNA-directed RNA polymerase specialized sigma subunit
MNRETAKCIERNLKLYRTYEATIANCKRQLDYMLPSGVTSYDFDRGGNSGQVTSTTERSALERLESTRAIEMHKTIERYTLIIQSVDRALCGLEDLEKRFVELRYFKNFSMEQVAELIKYSLRTVYEIKRKTLEKLEISLVSLMSNL